MSAAETARDGGELAILVRGPHGKNNRREELLHAKGAEDVSVSLYYNKKSNKGEWILGDSKRSWNDFCRSDEARVGLHQENCSCHHLALVYYGE